MSTKFRRLVVGLSASAVLAGSALLAAGPASASTNDVTNPCAGIKQWNVTVTSDADINKIKAKKGATINVYVAGDLTVNKVKAKKDGVINLCFADEGTLDANKIKAKKGGEINIGWVDTDKTGSNNNGKGGSTGNGVATCARTAAAATSGK